MTYFTRQKHLILKANPYHDAQGRFTTKNGAHSVSIWAGRTAASGAGKGGGGKGGAEAVKDTDSAIAYLREQGIVAEGGYIAQHYTSTNEPAVLAAIGGARGFKGKPTLVSKQEMDALVKDGHRELFRGDARTEHRDQFVRGEHRYGVGVFGNGTYTAGYGDNNVSRDKALSNAEYYAGGNKAGMARMALRKDAKVVDHEDLLRMRKEEYTALNDHHANMFDRMKKDLEGAGIKLSDPRAEEFYNKHKALSDASRKKAEDFAQAFADEGAYAALKGFDAISERNNQYVVVLNRTKLYIED